MRVISRFGERGVEVFDADLHLVHTFPVFESREIDAYSVARARDRLVYVVDDAVICVGADGDELWRSALTPAAEDGVARATCAFSGDDRFVWIYSPEVVTGRGESDQWIVLDAATGVEHMRHALPAVAGQGGTHLAFSDGRMLLDVGAGQGGSRSFVAGPSSAPEAIDWENRVPVDLSPDEKQIMTVDHDQRDARFHDISDLPRVRPGAVVSADDDSIVEWTGGYLDAGTAIVVIAGAPLDDGALDEEAWWRHLRVDPRTGEILGDLGVSTIDEYDLLPLGDGTFVITDTDGTLRRM